ncbi:helix-turn-helix domain-containing protein [Williamsia deligens]|uniref:Helix-turn-helix domain-containing protein n=1 Tax=Williamsia deligens TaxID=321325 RepID=A0ABW3G3W4_9NOCA|nr:helix-turn-helix transcriptional regulator [Williamsia deligens]MCP2194001.1 Helix-turn-helix domain-containing protein [Williamsia deligens]
MTDLHVVPADEVPAAPAAAPLLRELLGATLRSARQRQQRTLKDVADRAGVSMTYLSEVERGQKEASSEVVGAVTRALGGDLVDLLSEMTSAVARPAPAAPARTTAIRAVA